MLPHRRLSPQAMTTEDRQFDTLLHRAAQYFEEATLEMQRQHKMLTEASLVAGRIEDLPRT